VPFLYWMIVAVPIAVAMLGFLLAYFARRSARRPAAADLRARLASERRHLGRPSRAERNVLVAFA